jgi:hypothetical protein
MCIIFYNEKGEQYLEAELRHAYRINSDGVGIMWFDSDEKVQAFQGMLSADDLVRKMMTEFVGVPHALHLRFRTHGPRNVEMCHPFKVTPPSEERHVWLMHNGVMGKYGALAKPGESDTAAFARVRREDVAKQGSNILWDPEYGDFIERELGSDRMIFFRSGADVLMFNPDKWIEDQKTGIWYSNAYSRLPSYAGQVYNANRWMGTGQKTVANRWLGTATGAMGTVSTVKALPAQASPSKIANSSSDLVEVFLRDAGLLLSSKRWNSWDNRSKGGVAAALAEDEAAFAEDESDDLEAEASEHGRVAYFRWTGSEYILCDEDESDFEMPWEEYMEDWAVEDDEVADVLHPSLR